MALEVIDFAFVHAMNCDRVGMRRESFHGFGIETFPRITPTPLKGFYDILIRRLRLCLVRQFHMNAKLRYERLHAALQECLFGATTERNCAFKTLSSPIRD